MNMTVQITESSARWCLVIRTALCPRIVASSLRIALVVGLALNVINQGGALLDGKPISLGHALMNFLVPFCVASYSAAKNELARRHEQEQTLSGDCDE